jgi:transposase
MRLLEAYHGFLQSDDYSGYNAMAKRDGMIHVGCLDHARRRFVKAVQAQLAISDAEQGLAPEALLIIRKLYAIEKLARDANMTPDQQHKLRAETTEQIWDELRASLDKNLGAVPPQSLSGKAISCLAADWPRRIRYLENGRTTRSNVFFENAIRPFVTRRKKWLFSDTSAGANASKRQR